MKRYREGVATYTGNLAWPAEGLPYARRAVEIFTSLRKPDSLAYAQATLKECSPETQESGRVK